MTSHLDDGTIQELLDGEIPSSELGPLQAHLESCSTCRVRLDAARTMAAESEELLELLDEPITPAATPVVVAASPSARPRTWVRTLAWAASVAVAVGAGWYARGDVERVLPAPTVIAPAGEDAIAVSPQASATEPTAKESTPPSAPRAASAPVVTKPVAANEPAKALAEAPERRERADVAELGVTPRVTAPSASMNTATVGREVAPPAAAPVALGGGLDMRNARALGSASSEASRLVPRDQVVTRQLIDATGTSDTLAIRIAAMRTLLESVGPSLPKDIAVMCVAFSESQHVGQSPVESQGGGDLPESVLALLAPAPRPVRPSSACSVSAIAPMPIIEAKTGLPAVSFLVGGVRFSGSDKATVGLQHWLDGRWAGGHRCELERRNGVWVAVKCTGTWVA